MRSTSASRLTVAAPVIPKRLRRSSKCKASSFLHTRRSTRDSKEIEADRGDVVMIDSPVGRSTRDSKEIEAGSFQGSAKLLK